MTPARKIVVTSLTIVLGAVFLAGAQPPKPVLEYQLDESGTMAVSVGSDDLPLTLFNASGAPADMHSADFEGVSGHEGDRAFDNTSATGMGGSGIGGVALIPTNIESAGTFSSFTLQCWFNASQPLAKGARLFDSGRYVVFAGSKPGVVWLTVNHRHTGTAAVYTQTNEWVFFAVTYDGTRTSNNVVFYRGTKDSPVVQVGPVATLNGGPVTNAHAIGIGNLFYSNVRPFLGYMDDVRIFGTSADDSSVLTQSQLETIRQADLVNLPVKIASATPLALVTGANNPAPFIENPRHTTKGFTLNIQTVADAKYSVLWSTNLVDWQSLKDFTGDGNTMAIQDTNNLPRAFYRIQRN